MRTVYRGLAYAIAALVALQAAFIAYAVSGLAHWIQQGGTLDAAAFSEESTVEVGGGAGFMLHGMTGTLLIPLLALVLLVISFFARIPGGTKWAAIVFGLVVLKYALVLVGRIAGLPFLGALHGLNALILFGAAVTAGIRLRRVAPVRAAEPESVSVA